MAGAAMLLALSATAASAASLRFLHAVPGAGPVDVRAGDRVVASGVGFGAASDYSRVPTGSLEVVVGEQQDPLIEQTVRLSAGLHTIVAVPDGDVASLLTLDDARGRAGTALVRAVHAAGELGSPNVRVSDRTIADDISFKDATPYRSVEPGTYTLAAGRRNGAGGAVASREGVTLTAGTATTAVLIGTAGEATRFVVLEDGTFAPREAPATGFGGLADGSGGGWPAVLAAALFAGALGGAAYLLTFRRRPRRRHDA